MSWSWRVGSCPMMASRLRLCGFIRVTNGWNRVLDVRESIRTHCKTQWLGVVGLFVDPFFSFLVTSRHRFGVRQHAVPLSFQEPGYRLCRARRYVSSSGRYRERRTHRCISRQGCRSRKSLQQRPSRCQSRRGGGNSMDEIPSHRRLCHVGLALLSSYLC